MKASVYFDKTLLPLRDKLVKYEGPDLDEKLNNIANNLESSSDESWEDYTDDLIDSIGILIYPKKLCAFSDNRVIFNTDNEPITLEKAQYFIELPVEAHILGVLWVLTVGVALDNRNDDDNSVMYEHSYGNRLRKSLFNSETHEITYSPNLFESYFAQYESWRDKALEYAKERLNDKQDALILTLDLKSFFYSVHIPKEDFDAILKCKDNLNKQWIKRIHFFVYQILVRYSDVLSQTSIDPELQISGRTILPIGFFPSNILSNWVLTPFDNAIVKRLNPVYYGRYVDDIIIVDKVEKNSPLRKKALDDGDGKLTTKDVIDYYFRTCAADRKLPKECAHDQELFIPVVLKEIRKMKTKKISKISRNVLRAKKEDNMVFRINPVILSPKNRDETVSDIKIQNNKVKVFYFREGATRALLDCFRTQICKNASEFRFFPDIDTVLTKNDYSEIFQLSNTETLHKLRGVSGVAIDKFSLSKFLGKYRKVGGMIRDKKENAFEKDLFAILNKRTLIENYTLWERLLEIMVANDRFDSYEKLVENILTAIVDFEIPGNIVKKEGSYNRKRALLLTLRSAICRTSALCWGAKINTVLERISLTIKKKIAELEIDIGRTDIFDGFENDRRAYCQSKMINKYVMPLPIWCINGSVYSEEKSNINLCKLEDTLAYFDDKWKYHRYSYFPYMVTPQELSFAQACSNIASQKRILDPEEQLETMRKLYSELNYPNLIGSEQQSDSTYALDSVCAKPIKNLGVHNHHCISVQGEDAKTIRVAIGNARLYENDFKLALTRRANRSYARYRQLSRLLRSAIEEKVELLVLPENYLPWEWLPDVARLCANNQIAIVTGVEHIISPGNKKDKRGVYNLTAVILPYRKDEYSYAHVVFHQKVHFSPEEKRMIEGYRFVPMRGDNYQLFQWKDLWFSVYCCYELASLHERALFQSFADLTVAVEWNKDINYFSNIIESMCRDLHCYCIQANSSEYGDSRVMAPAKSEIRDIIKTKGGNNSTILVDEIDIYALRDFQRMEYELQRQDGRFKPTPPNFDANIVEHKQNKTLWNYIVGEE